MTEREVADNLETTRASFYRGGDGQWYWTLPNFTRPVGPFQSIEEVRADYRNVMGIDKARKK